MSEDIKVIMQSGSVFNNHVETQNNYFGVQPRQDEPEPGVAQTLSTVLIRFAAEKDKLHLTWADMLRFYVGELHLPEMNATQWGHYVERLTGVKWETVRRNGDYTRTKPSPGDELARQKLRSLFA